MCRANASASFTSTDTLSAAPRSPAERPWPLASHANTATSSISSASTTCCQRPPCSWPRWNRTIARRAEPEPKLASSHASGCQTRYARVAPSQVVKVRSTQFRVRVISLPRGFAPRPPLHALSRAASLQRKADHSAREGLPGKSPVEVQASRCPYGAWPLYWNLRKFCGLMYSYHVGYAMIAA